MNVIPAWPESRIFQLIDEYKKCENLWISENIKDASAVAVWTRRQEWERIATVLSSESTLPAVTATNCKNRISRCRAIFNARRAEIKKNIENGLDPERTEIKPNTGDIIKAQKIYEALTFLTHNDQYTKVFDMNQSTQEIAANKAKDGGTSKVEIKKANAGRNQNINIKVKRAATTSYVKLQEEEYASNTSVYIQVEDGTSTNVVSVKRKFDDSSNFVNVKEEFGADNSNKYIKGEDDALTSIVEIHEEFDASNLAVEVKNEEDPVSSSILNAEVEDVVSNITSNTKVKDNQFVRSQILAEEENSDENTLLKIKTDLEMKKSVQKSIKRTPAKKRKLAVEERTRKMSQSKSSIQYNSEGGNTAQLMPVNETQVASNEATSTVAGQSTASDKNIKQDINFYLFCIGKKIKSYTPTTRDAVRKEISHIIFQADHGLYENKYPPQYEKFQEDSDELMSDEDV